MNRRTYGAIDIGSNAIRLLINYVEQDGKSLIYKKAAFVRVPIRLGEDVFNHGKVSDEKKERLANAMMGFSSLLKTFNVDGYRACATSAMREAGNGAEVIDYIKETSGISLEIITGEIEADTIFAASDSAGIMNPTETYLFVDVGGGSTEVTVYSGGRSVARASFPIGTVRMISDAVGKESFKEFKEWLEKEALPFSPIAIVGSGGNINKVHKLLSKKEREDMTYVELKILYEHLKDMSYDQRVKNLGLNAYRADVIMPAMKIFLTASKQCRISRIMVPKIGLADGIIHTLATKQ